MFYSTFCFLFALEVPSSRRIKNCAPFLPMIYMHTRYHASPQKSVECLMGSIMSMYLRKAVAMARITSLFRERSRTRLILHGGITALEVRAKKDLSTTIERSTTGRFFFNRVVDCLLNIRTENIVLRSTWAEQELIVQKSFKHRRSHLCFFQSVH